MLTTIIVHLYKLKVNIRRMFSLQTGGKLSANNARQPPTDRRECLGLKTSSGQTNRSLAILTIPQPNVTIFIQLLTLTGLASERRGSSVKRTLSRSGSGTSSQHKNHRLGEASEKRIFLLVFQRQANIGHFGDLNERRRGGVAAWRRPQPVATYKS